MDRWKPANWREKTPKSERKLRLGDRVEKLVKPIAKALKLEQKPLYRRIEKLLFDLRRALESSGVSVDLVRSAIADRGFDGGGWESRGEVRPFDRGPSPAEVEKVS